MYNTLQIDCLEYLATVPDTYFDLAIVDPPYGINAPKMNMGSNPTRNEKGQYPGTSTSVKLRTNRFRGSGKLKNRILNSSNTSWDCVPPSKQYFDELFRVSKNQIIWGANYFDLPATRCMICWDKKQPWKNFSQFELAWTSFDKPAKMYRISSRGGSNKIGKIHPTEKPIQLYSSIYNDFAKPEFKILDTHLGSGTNKIAAYKFGIEEFIGCEINKEYFEAEAKRFEVLKNMPEFSPCTPLQT